MLASFTLHALTVVTFACTPGSTPDSSIVGTWWYRQELRAGVFDAGRRRLGYPFAEAATYTFRPDGRYEYYRSRTSSTGTGNLELTWSTIGSYVMRGQLLVLTPERTTFVSHSDIPDTPTGAEAQSPGASITLRVRFAGDSAGCALELPADRGVNRMFELRRAPPLIPR